MKHSKFDKKKFQKSYKTPLQRRGEENLEKPQKLKKIRLKLLKCEKAENKFKILAKSQKVTHSSRISHYIMVAEHSLFPY